MILAAIDIGSNAARLLIARVQPGHQIDIISLDRLALGLGFDAFETGRISPEREQPLLQAMQFFKGRMEENQVQDYRAFATAAMRVAENAEDIIARILKETGLRLEVISGEKEARLNFLNHALQAGKGSGIFIDVGGGSTELTIFSENRETVRRSFPIGAIRLFKEQVSLKDWEEMQDFLQVNLATAPGLKAYGTGGSISKLFSVFALQEGSMMRTETLKEKLAELSAVTPRERIDRYGIEPDRAELIIPALGIFARILDVTGIEGIFAHRAGLANGMIRSLAKELRG